MIMPQTVTSRGSTRDHSPPSSSALETTTAPANDHDTYRSESLARRLVVALIAIQRDTSPHALLRDRHISRSGQAHASELSRKQGGGPHNWGKLENEEDYETLAQHDAELERQDEPAPAAGQDKGEEKGGGTV